jgi:hypothetical protein
MAGFLLAGLIGEKMDTLFLLSAAFYLFCFLQTPELKDILKPRLDIPYFSLNTLLKNSGIYFSLFLRHTGAPGFWAFFPCISGNSEQVISGLGLSTLLTSQSNF